MENGLRIGGLEVNFGNLGPSSGRISGQCSVANWWREEGVFFADETSLSDDQKSRI